MSLPSEPSPDEGSMSNSDRDIGDREGERDAPGGDANSDSVGAADVVDDLDLDDEHDVVGRDADREVADE